MFQIKDSLSALVSSLLVPFLLHHLPSSLAPSMSPLAVSGHFASLLSKHHNYGPQEQAIESRGEIWNSATIDKLNTVLFLTSILLILILVSIIAFCPRCTLLVDHLCCCLNFRAFNPALNALHEPAIADSKRTKRFDKMADDSEAHSHEKCHCIDLGKESTLTMCIPDREVSSQDMAPLKDTGHGLSSAAKWGAVSETTSTVSS